MEVIDNAIGKTAGATKELVSSRAFVCPGTQSELTGKLNRPGVSCCHDQGKSTSGGMPCLRFLWQIDLGDGHSEQNCSSSC